MPDGSSQNRMCVKRSVGLLYTELADADPEIHSLIRFEEDRQLNKLIMIPSESLAPKAVREALASVFTNLYAEGYPSTRMMFEREKTTDFARHLAFHRRYGDRRYYKGTEYVNFVEVLAQHRCAELFASDGVPAHRIFVNVQPLSGAAANNAVYDAFLNPGDTVMGMSLTHGGHLTHGNPLNRSGKYYKIFSYGVSRVTERIDYDEVHSRALEVRPKMIVAGASAYPWDIDWKRLREIADEVGAILFADIAHTAGLVVAGLFPNPVGHAHVITFTTHKTICGPRGAVIMTTDEAFAQRIDTAVFPGEQGGPHVNNIAAKAVCFHLARSEEFKTLQRRIVDNARYLAEELSRRGLKLAYGGTNTHMFLIDLKSIKQESGVHLRGDVASSILDICGITCNKNTIPGDESAAYPTGIRFGTVILSQMGMGKDEMAEIADIIHLVLRSIKTFSVVASSGVIGRGKIPWTVIEKAQERVRSLLFRCGYGRPSAYPHFEFPTAVKTLITPLYPLHQTTRARFTELNGWRVPEEFTSVSEEVEAAGKSAICMDCGDYGLLHICGERAFPFLQQVATRDLANLSPGQVVRSFILDAEHKLLDDVLIVKNPSDSEPFDKFLVVTNPANTHSIKSFLRALSDGYVDFNNDDIYAKIEGPVVVEDLTEIPDAERRLTAVVITGPKASDILRELGIKNIPSENRVCDAKFGNIRISILNTRTEGYLVLVREADAALFWKSLTTRAKPAGVKARDTLRESRGLPVYTDAFRRPSASELYPEFPGMFGMTKCFFMGQKTVLKKISAGKSQNVTTSDSMSRESHPTISTPRGTGKTEFQFEPQEMELRKTHLYEEHLRLTKKSQMIPFAGWSMPVWYSRVSEEHDAVRKTAALFDVSHMGRIEISGEHATRFLDIVTTNYVRRLRPRQCAYSYLLDPRGNVIDDIFLYCLAYDRYMMVVNASNAEKVWAWLNAVNERRVVIDLDNPAMEIEGSVTLTDLRDKASGDKQRVNIALQGPVSLTVLQRLAGTAEKRDLLARIKKSEFIETSLDGTEVLVARTGYTGEDIGYEIYVSVSDASRLWRLLLERGEDLGVKPAGLAARDSARTEAGLPLYGHELAGEHNIIPLEAGYGAFVKRHKPFFIGRRPMLEKEAASKMTVVRFALPKGARTVKTGDPVVDKRGEIIGHVTSCALAGETQIGMAFVSRIYAKEGTRIGVFPLPKGKASAPEKAKSELSLGDRVLLHEEAVVLSRFLRRT